MSPSAILARAMARVAPPAYRPRATRDELRRRRVCDAVRAEGGTAMDAALSAISTINDRSARVNRAKQRVEMALCSGASSEAVRCFYSLVTQRVIDAGAATLDQAIAVVRGEQATTAGIEARYARRLGNRRDALADAMLALRWLRRYRPDIDVRRACAAMARGPDRAVTIEIIAAE